MTEKIKLTSDELRLMSLFQNITSATAEIAYWTKNGQGNFCC